MNIERTVIVGNEGPDRNSELLASLTALASSLRDEGFNLVAFDAFRIEDTSKMAADLCGALLQNFGEVPAASGVARQLLDFIGSLNQTERQENFSPTDVDAAKVLVAELVTAAQQHSQFSKTGVFAPGRDSSESSAGFELDNASMGGGASGSFVLAGGAQFADSHTSSSKNVESEADSHRLTLDRFAVIKKELGKGGMGQVFLYESLDTGQRGAVKMPLKRVRDLWHRVPANEDERQFLEQQKNDLLKMLAREVLLLVSIESPYVLQAHGLVGDVDTERTFEARTNLAKAGVLLPFINGGDLSSHIKEFHKKRGEPTGKTISRELELERASLLDMFAKALEGVDALHKVRIPLAVRDEHGNEKTFEFQIIHRDLKPGNIMISLPNHPRVADFGLALFKPVRKQDSDYEITGSMSFTVDELGLNLNEDMLGAGPVMPGMDLATSVSVSGTSTFSEAGAFEQTQTGVIKGSLGFMAPEQFAIIRHNSEVQKGKTTIADHLDERTDQYAMGAALYEMLCNKYPRNVTGKEAQEFMIAVQTGKSNADLDLLLSRIYPEKIKSPHDIDPSVPKELSAIAMKMLAVKPEDRFASIQDVIAEISNYQLGLPVECYRASLGIGARILYDTKKWAQKHPMIAGSLLGASTLALVGASAWFATERAKVSLAKESITKAQATALLQISEGDIPSALATLENALETSEDFQLFDQQKALEKMIADQRRAEVAEIMENAFKLLEEEQLGAARDEITLALLKCEEYEITDAVSLQAKEELRKLDQIEKDRIFYRSVVDVGTPLSNRIINVFDIGGLEAPIVTEVKDYLSELKIESYEDLAARLAEGNFSEEQVLEIKKTIGSMFLGRALRLCVSDTFRPRTEAEIEQSKIFMASAKETLKDMVHPGILMCEALILDAEGKYQNASDLRKEAAAIKPLTPYDRTIMALAILGSSTNSGQSRQAISLIEVALNEDNSLVNIPAVLLGLGVAYSETGQPGDAELAVSYLQAAILQDPKAVEPYYYLLELMFVKQSAFQIIYASKLEKWTEAALEAENLQGTTGIRVLLGKTERQTKNYEIARELLAEARRFDDVIVERTNRPFADIGLLGEELKNSLAMHLIDGKMNNDMFPELYRYFDEFDRVVATVGSDRVGKDIYIAKLEVLFTFAGGRFNDRNTDLLPVFDHVESALNGLIKLVEEDPNLEEGQIDFSKFRGACFPFKNFPGLSERVDALIERTNSLKERGL